MAARRRRIRPTDVMYGVLGVIAVVLIGNLILDAIGGPEPIPELTSAGRPYASALEGALQTERPEQTAYNGLSAETARCVAPDWVMVLGPDRLDRAGVAPAELAEDPVAVSREAEITWEEAEAILRTYESCDAAPIDRMRSYLTAETDADDPVLGPETSRCIAEKLDGDTARRLFVLGLTAPTAIGGDLSLHRDVQNVAAQCETGG